jgi:endonuclease YncB( thermonuclease family)
MWTLLIVRAVSAVLLLTLNISSASAESWHICGRFEKRITCVVDGDTFWFQGKKIRILGIDAPEVEGACRRETRLASEATAYLTSLLNSGSVRIQFQGYDQYGRHLAAVTVAAGPVDQLMIASGFAEPYGSGRPAPWCGI